MRASCNDKHLAEKLHNIEDVFAANGHLRETVRRLMEQRPQEMKKRKKDRKVVES